MKVLNIKVVYDETKIMTKIDSRGITDDVGSLFEIVGILENLKQEQLKKINTLLNKSK
jgi:hypothetical protein